MSGIIVVQKQDAIEILTDTAAYDMDGTLTSVTARKCFRLPGMTAALAFRGITSVGDALFRAVERTRLSFDRLVEEFEFMVGLCADWSAPQLPDRFRSSLYEFTLAGWSESRKRLEAHYVIHSVELAAKVGVEAGKLIPVADLPGWDGSLVQPQDSAVKGVVAGVASRLTSIEDFGPGSHGVEIMKAMRQNRAQLDPDLAPATFHNVGGSVRLTRVRRAGVTERIVHRWPEDRVGSLILPQSTGLMLAA